MRNQLFRGGQGRNDNEIESIGLELWRWSLAILAVLAVWALCLALTGSRSTSCLAVLAFLAVYALCRLSI